MQRRRGGNQCRRCRWRCRCRRLRHPRVLRCRRDLRTYLSAEEVVVVAVRNTTAPSPGSGGGGGGGAIHIAALSAISFGTAPNLGVIAASGGNGGAIPNSGDGNADCGGAGGGGAGGSIWLQSGGSVGDASDMGTTFVGGGSAPDATCGAGGDGGNGSDGILRIDTATAPQVTASPASSTFPSPLNPNVAVAPQQTYVTLSKDHGHRPHHRHLPSSDRSHRHHLRRLRHRGRRRLAHDPVRRLQRQRLLFGRCPGLADLYARRLSVHPLQSHAADRSDAPVALPHGLTIPDSSSAFELQGGLACGTTTNRDKGGGNPLDALSDLGVIALAVAAALLPGRRKRTPA